MAVLLAIGGHTGTGKTTLAYRLRKECPALKTALIIEDDEIRRELLGIGLGQVMSDTDYSEDVSRNVLEDIKIKTAGALSSGISVINSSGFFSSAAQGAVEDMAKDASAPFAGLWLTASRPKMEERIAKRNKVNNSLGAALRISNKFRWKTVFKLRSVICMKIEAIIR